jgi:hypothetical protein
VEASCSWCVNAVRSFVSEPLDKVLGLAFVQQSGTRRHNREVTRCQTIYLADRRRRSFPEVHLKKPTRAILIEGLEVDTKGETSL